MFLLQGILPKVDWEIELDCASTAKENRGEGLEIGAKFKCLGVWHDLKAVETLFPNLLGPWCHDPESPSKTISHKHFLPSTSTILIPDVLPAEAKQPLFVTEIEDNPRGSTSEDVPVCTDSTSLFKLKV